MILPEQDAVLAITAGLGNMQAVLELVWKHLLPALNPAPLAEDHAAQETLRKRLAALALKTPPGQPDSPLAARISGQTYRFAENEQNITAVTFDFGGETNVLRIVREQGEQQIPCGAGGEWRRGMATLEQPRCRAASCGGERRVAGRIHLRGKTLLL